MMVRRWMTEVGGAAVLVLLLALAGLGGMIAMAQEPPAAGEVGVYFIKYACPNADADVYTECDIVTGATFRVEVNGEEIEGSPFTTEQTGLLPGFSFRVPVDATLTITEVGGVPDRYVPAPGFGPLTVNVVDLPEVGCGGESTCPGVQFINVPGLEETVPTVTPDPGNGGAALTIHHRACPAGFDGPDFYSVCHDNPLGPWELRLRGPEDREEQTDANGNLTFAGLTPGTYEVLGGGGPTDFVGLHTFCAPASNPGTEFPSTTERLTGGPGAFSVELTLSAGDDVVCDFYVLPVDLGPPDDTEDTEDAGMDDAFGETGGPDDGNDRGGVVTMTPSSPGDDGRPVIIITGSCNEDELESVERIAGLTDLIEPEGEAVGRGIASVPETSFTTIERSLDELVAEDHAIAIQSDQAEGELVACGDIAGILTSNGDLVLALRELNNSGFAGVAFLSSNPDDPGQTDISLFLVAGLADEERDGTPVVR